VTSKWDPNFVISNLSDGSAVELGLFNSIAYGLNASVRRAISERLELPNELVAVLGKEFKKPAKPITWSMDKSSSVVLLEIMSPIFSWFMSKGKL
ncbi:hypothetical protein Goklo_015640, partial [Gossypium klotzschianum]|nr:hypothetical protein [Gossypium klotzschianum]